MPSANMLCVAESEGALAAPHTELSEEETRRPIIIIGAVNQGSLRTRAV